MARDTSLKSNEGNKIELRRIREIGCSFGRLTEVSMSAFLRVRHEISHPAANAHLAIGRSSANVVEGLKADLAFTHKKGRGQTPAAS